MQLAFSPEGAQAGVMQLYRAVNGRIVAEVWQHGQPINDDVVWIDLLDPQREQESAAEAFLGMDIPTLEEMGQIEVSNRLYEESDMLFMTATMLTKVDTGEPQTHPVTFIVSEKRLITVRYLDTTSFRRFATLFIKSPPKKLTGITVFLAMLETIINRKADILQRMDREVDAITRTIFQHRESGDRGAVVNYQQVLERIGRCGDIVAKIHESLVTFGRVTVFAAHHEECIGLEHAQILTSLHRDVTGLSDHGTHLAARVNFLLDATLGMISIQQNNVFRVLSVASLIFLPPTLIAGVYGMNFHEMPELTWNYGYPVAIGLMVFAAILPLAYLRQRRWL